MLIPRAGMAGHSKWSTIKRQKGAEDMKRSVNPSFKIRARDERLSAMSQQPLLKGLP